MARPLLFDISDIDKNKVVITREEVGEIIPQSGDMRQLNHVIWFSDDCGRALGVKYVQADEFWVAGHIPGRPLMPGVLMIEAGAQLASVLYWRKVSKTHFLGFTRCDNVVFRSQVVPGDTLYLLAEEVSLRTKRFVMDTQGVVNGVLVFEARVTGMAM